MRPGNTTSLFIGGPTTAWLFMDGTVALAMDLCVVGSTTALSMGGTTTTALAMDYRTMAWAMEFYKNGTLRPIIFGTEKFSKTGLVCLVICGNRVNGSRKLLKWECMSHLYIWYRGYWSFGPGTVSSSNLGLSIEGTRPRDCKLKLPGPWTVFYNNKVLDLLCIYLLYYRW